MSLADNRGVIKLMMVGVLCAVGAVMPEILPGREGQEIGFLEDFALSQDREKTLEQLVPGQEEWFFYRGLHLLNTGRLEEIPQLLDDWTKRHERSSAREQIRQRYYLQLYETDPEATIAWLKDEFDPYLEAKKSVPGEEPDLPTSLDQSRLDFDRIAEELLKRPDAIGHFDPSALPKLLNNELSDTQLRQLLGNLLRPDHEGLTALILRDLRAKGGQFGSLPIHERLLLSQLNSLKREEPSLLGQQAFITQYLRRLAPRDGINLETNNEAREEYLNRLLEFTRELPPSFNTLKAFALRQRLEFDLSIGRFERNRFIDYLKLPRDFAWINPEILRKTNSGERVQDFSQWQERIGILPPLPPEDALIRAYLLHFFVDANGWGEFSQYLKEDYLKRIYAEAKLLDGVGDAEEWYALLTPDQLQDLRDRVDLEFLPSNAKQFDRDAPVRLHLWVKNVPSLIVRTYHINTGNYYRQHGEDVTTAVNLDGLVANAEQTHAYDEPPLRRVRRTFEFPEMSGPGVWIVEFIGNGVSSRAVVRKGRLQYVERLSSAGHVLAVYDEKNRPVPDAAAWLDGRYFAPEEDGTLTIPFSTNQEQKDLVLVAGDFASLTRFSHLEENYDLTAAIMLLREQLVTGNKAVIQIRPKLFVHYNGALISPELLENVSVTVNAGGESAGAEQVFENLQVDETGLLEVEVNVPPGRRKIDVTLRAEVPYISQSGRAELQVSDSLEFGTIRAQPLFEQVLLTKNPEGFVAEVRGINGEPIAGKPVEVTLSLEDLVDHPIKANLQSDETGRIALGALENVESLTFQAGGSRESRQVYNLAEWRPVNQLPPVVQSNAGEEILVPYHIPENFELEQEVSLLEIRESLDVGNKMSSAAAPIRDWIKAVTANGGFLRINGLPAGDYSLYIRPSGQHVYLRVEEGAVQQDWVLGRVRHLQTLIDSPLQITAVTETGENLEITLANADPLSRVRIEAARYLPQRDLAQYLLRSQVPLQMSFQPAALSYESGRQISDEYRYVIERQFAEKFPGNLLTRPTLLINPWERETTQMQEELLREGDSFAGEAKMLEVMPSEAEPARERAMAAGEFGASDISSAPGSHGALFPSLDFLSESAMILTDLRPDEAGIVRIPLAQLQGKPMIRIIAMSPRHTAIWPLTRAGEEFTPRDRRLAEAFDPNVPRAQEKRIEILTTGTEKRLEDVGPQDLALYQSLEEVMELYRALLPGNDLSEFSFLTRWDTLPQDERRRLYTEHGGHELHFFLYKKDRPFFDEVVRPYLENKLQKTFLDEYLLERDLSKYLAITEFRRLNIVEQILLIQRLPDAAPGIIRRLEETLALQPISPEQRENWFDAALQVQQLRAEILAPEDEMTEEQLLRAEKKAAMLSQIIIPEIDFRDATVRDAIEYLRQQSIRLDPAGEGINLVIRGGQDSGKERITLRLSNVPLGEALRYVTSQAGLTFEVEEYAVTIVPEGADAGSGSLMTRQFQAPPDFIPAGQDARGVLERVGVSFPGGASASYIEATGKLVVRNTTENLKLVEDLTSGMMMSAPPAPAAPALDFEDASADEDVSTMAGVAFGGRSHFARQSASDKLRLERITLKLYRTPETTRQIAETYYFETERAWEQNLFPSVNEFWLDYARHLAGENPAAPFVTPHIAQATGSATEALFALAVLDLPLNRSTARRAAFAMDDAGVITLDLPGDPDPNGSQPVAVLYYKDVSPGELAEDANQDLFVSERFFQHGERFQRGGSNSQYNYLTDEFLTGTIYGGHIVITNPTSATRDLNVLWQVPQGAIPVAGGEMTEIRPLRLEPFATQQIEFFFYFPQPGEFPLYPVHVSDGRTVLAAAEARTFTVVPFRETIDNQSWEYISQMAETDALFTWLEEHSLAELSREDWFEIQWRMDDPAVFQRTLAFLRERHIYSEALWVYGLKHNDTQAIREYLEAKPEFLANTGGWLRSALLEIQPFPLHLYQHLEYAPLINARRHAIGDRTVILNNQLREQYRAFLNIVKYKPALEPDDKLALAYYLFLQDRVGEALAWLEQIEPGTTSAPLQHDYLQAYAAFYQENLPLAREIAQKHVAHPVERWRDRFELVLAQLEEISGESEERTTGRRPRGPRSGRGNPDQNVADRNLTEDQAQLAQAEAGVNLSIKEGRIQLTGEGVDEVQLNFYLMDVEMLFSRDPFLVVDRGSGRAVSQKDNAFAIVEPHMSQTVAMQESQGRREATVEIPQELAGKNLVIEAVAGGARQTLPYYSNQLRVDLRENYGQLRVLHAETGKPLPQVYVKVYTRTSKDDDAEPIFYKDGYTDLRGLFDYSSLSSTLFKEAADFAILILSPEHGAGVRLARPPLR